MSCGALQVAGQCFVAGTQLVVRTHMEGRSVLPTSVTPGLDLELGKAPCSSCQDMNDHFDITVEWAVR